MTEDELAECVRALFPIEAAQYRVELIDLDRNFAARLRLSTFNGNNAAGVMEHTVELLPSHHRNERGLAFLTASADFARETTVAQVWSLTPSRVFLTDLLDTDLSMDAAVIRRLHSSPRALRALELHLHADGIYRPLPHRWSFARLVLDPARRPPPPCLFNEALEAVILERPDDRAGYMVYGDWLSQHGDPRGELISVQCALADRSDEPALREREAYLLGEYAYELLGELAWSASSELTVTWRYGFPYRVCVGATRGQQCWRGEEALVHACAQLRLVHELVIGRFAEQYTCSKTIGALARYGAPHGLRALSILSHCDLGDLEPAYPALAGIETLTIEAQRGEFGDIKMPELRSFQYASRDLTRQNIGSLQRAHWPKLRRLALELPEAPIDEGDATLDDLDWLFAGQLPITELQLAGAPIDDAIERLAVSAILPRLTALDLSFTSLRGDPVMLLRRYAGRFEHLQQFRVPNTSDS